MAAADPGRSGDRVGAAIVAAKGASFVPPKPIRALRQLTRWSEQRGARLAALPLRTMSGTLA